MQFRLFSLFALFSLVACETLIETVTSHRTTEATITSCSDHACTSTTRVKSTTVITTTVGGVETIYTTVCPETMPKAPKSEGNSYVDITSTPAVTVSTGVATTLFMQSSRTKYYNSSSTKGIQPSMFENKAPHTAVLGLVGAAGLVAYLL